MAIHVRQTLLSQAARSGEESAHQQFVSMLYLEQELFTLERTSFKDKSCTPRTISLSCLYLDYHIKLEAHGRTENREMTSLGVHPSQQRTKKNVVKHTTDETTIEHMPQPERCRERASHNCWFTAVPICIDRAAGRLVLQV